MPFLRAAAALMRLLGVSLAGLAPAAADDRHRHGWSRHEHDGWRGHAHRPFHRPHRSYFGYYAPPVVVWRPAPVYPAYPAYPAAPAPAAEPVIQAVPGPEFRDENGRHCREYQRTVTIDGQPQQIHGTACLMPDGTWRIVS